MKVILKENVETLGKTGDMVKVSDGYARNFLIPKGLAIEASKRNIKVLAHERKTIEQKAEKEKKNAEELRGKLENVICTIARKEGEQGKLFGSVTAKDVEQELSAQGIKIDRKNINMDVPIKSIGEFQITVKIYPGVNAEIKVVVVSET
ncbi:MAG: 50S ribosomal protein L9 [Deltaproteobacteria bacterium]|nr:50S ribosomal protein L9 [Deltaproteobacteria bacterium]